MRFIGLVLIFLVFLSCNNNKEKQAADIQNSKMTSIGFSTRIIDFGNVSNDTNIVAVFYLKNIGKRELIIKEVDPDCSCTGFLLEKYNVSSGDSTRLIVNYNTKGQIKGFQRKAIIINSNTKKEYNTLFIRCNIIDD